jgi:pilin isopeptide linkage protein
MNIRKCKKRAASLGMAFLITTGLFSFQAFADESDENAQIASVSLVVELDIEGDTPDEDVPFTFIMEEKDEDDNLVEDTSYATIYGEGTTVFGEVTFDEPGEYEYDIYERNDGVENYTYDDNVYHMNVDVKYDRKGNLVASCTATSEKTVDVDGKTADVVFVNTFDEKTPDPIPENDTSILTEEPTTEVSTTSEEVTTEEIATSEEVTTEGTTTSEEVTTTEETTTSEEVTTTEEITTSEEVTTEETTTSEEVTTEETTTSEEVTTEETTTSEEVTTEETTTTEEVTTEEPTTSEEVTTEEPTTSEEVTTSEEPTTEVSTTPSDSNNHTKTGDETNLILLVVLLCAAVLGMTGCIWYRNMSGKHDKGQNK